MELIYFFESIPHGQIVTTNESNVINKLFYFTINVDYFCIPQKHKIIKIKLTL
jgi:hypothetical protein